jgi:phage tail-like protein
MNGTSWLLGGGYPWFTGSIPPQPGVSGSAVVANEIRGLSLAALIDGPLGLESPDGSLGGLTLPLGIAVDGDAVFVLSQDGSRIFRYDPIRMTLTPLPEIGAEGVDPDAPAAVFDEPRRFNAARNIAASGGALFVAEARRVQVFNLETLELIRIHAGLQDPVDLTAARDGVYILERGAGRVWRGTAQQDRLQLVLDRPDLKGRFDRIAVDRSGTVYLRDATAKPPSLLEFAIGPGATKTVSTAADPAEVRERFDVPDISIDARGGIVLPDRLLDPCGVRRPLGPYMRKFAVGDRVYVIDSRERTVSVRLADGRVRRRFGPYNAAGALVVADSDDAWSPVDLVTVDGCVLILDEAHQAVLAQQPGSDALRTRFTAPPDHEMRWRRLAADGTGCLLLWDAVADTVDRVDQNGQIVEQVSTRKVRAYFAQPGNGSDTAPIAHVRLTRAGAVSIPPKEPPVLPAPAFERAGVWTSRWLDSDIFNCQWHSIELVVTLPPGSRVRVRTRTSNEAQSDAEVGATAASVGALGSWADTAPLVGPAQPSDTERQPQSVDLLVLSGVGQHLQLQVELSGDGITTPSVRQLRVRFPRESLLQYLPAIYSQPEDQRAFLDPFLSIMQTTWSGIERQVDTFERYLDPDSVPAEAMSYLAGWLDLHLEGRWNPEQNRRLLQAMPSLRAKWGTAAGLCAWLRVYLSNLSGVSIEQLERAGIPGIVESFVERRRLMLNRSDTSTLCASEALWGPGVERRFQVGVFDREGDVELVSDGHPELDLFRRYAHSFRVYIPAAWLRTPDDEALIRRAIELQKPVHATYELALVEPRFRLGEQSTIDLDTVIGGPAPAPLVCATVEDAPSRPPYQRLGYDTTLGCGNDNGGM